MRTKLVATNLIWAVALTTSVLWLHHTRPVLMDWHTVPEPHEQLPLKTLDEIRAEGVRLGVRDNEIQDAIRGQAILKRDAEVATLRAQLKADWTSLCVGRRHLDSCCGTATHGFRLIRSPSGIEVSTWFHPNVTGQPEQFGQPERLSQSHLDILIHELPLHFLSAWLSLDPSEIAGPFPTDRSGQEEWRRAYHAAGGTDRQRDLDWIEIRSVTASSVSSFVNLFGDDSPKDFKEWVFQFHKDEKKTASQ